VFEAIWDKEELPYVIFVYLVVIPAIWATYVAEPKQSLRAFQRLAKDGILGARTSSGATIDEFVLSQLDEFNRLWFAVVPVLVTLGILVLFTLANLPPNNPYLFGTPKVWTTLNPFYYWLVFVPFTFSSAYMLTWIVVRRYITVRVIDKVLAADS